MSCALILGSAKSKAFAKDRRIGLIAHQRTSHLQTALFNNVLGFTSGTLGADILKQGSDGRPRTAPEVDDAQRSIERVRPDTFAHGPYELSRRRGQLCVVAGAETDHEVVAGGHVVEGR